MIDYLKNILPRIQQYSKQLNNEANFVDIPWVFLDGDGHKVTYIFRRNNELLVSKKGEVASGRWEYLPMIQSLLVEYEGKKRMYNQGFLDQAVMILRKDGTEELFPLGNVNLLPDLNIPGYLMKKGEERGTKKNEEKQYSLEEVEIKDKGTQLILKSRFGDDPRYLGREMFFRATNTPFPDGTAELTNGYKIKVKEGKVVGVDQTEASNADVGILLFTIIFVSLLFYFLVFYFLT